MASDDLAALKTAGNTAFGSKAFEEAFTKYSEALALWRAGRGAGSPPPNADDKELAATLLSNRAAAALNLERFEEARDDCSEALKLQPGRIKALFRRAQAQERLGELAAAFKDLKTVIHHEPKNRPAIVAARRVKMALEDEWRERSPMALSLKELSAADTSPERCQELLKAMIGSTIDDVSTAMEVFRRGGVRTLWELTASDHGEQVQHLAVRVLAAMSAHPAFVDEALPQLDLPAVVALVDGHCQLATGALTLLARVLTSCTKPQAGGDLEANEERLTEPALDGWHRALAHAEAEVRDAALDAVVTWCSEAPPSWGEPIPPDEERRLPFQERKTRQEAAARWKAVLSHRAERLCTAPAALTMFSLLDSDVPSERAKSLAAFGRVASVVTELDTLKALLTPLLSMQGTGSGDAGGLDLAFSRRKAALGSAMFLANADLGVWMLERPNAVRELQLLIAAGDEIGQAAAAETVCMAASTENGRGLLLPIVDAGALEALLDSPNIKARSAAASTMAKLGVASKALASESSDAGRLLNTAMALLKGAEDEAEATDGGGASAAAAAGKTTATVATERAVEVLAALITRSAVKDEVAHGSGRCAQALARLSAACKDGKGAAAYGLAHIFASLTVTNKEVQERVLAEKEMEITADQLAELQRITKQRSETEEDEDTAEKVGWRIQKVAQHDGIRALARLCDGASPSTREQVALAFRQIAVELAVRGSMVQQGAFRACIDLAQDTSSTAKCLREAAWCLGKVLVTTNPNVLTEAQRMGCIAPLLKLCKDHKASDLAHFEALMGLTNVCSTGPETKRRVASEKGIRTLEYLQFSEHELVRRAATECMTNLLPDMAMVQHLRDGEKMKLWVALASDHEADLPTSRAASGLLAMAAGIEDEELMESIVGSKCCEVLVELLTSGHPELVHRAAAAIEYLADVPKAVTKLRAHSAEETLVQSAKTAPKTPDWEVARRACATAFTALKRAQEAPQSSTGPLIEEVDESKEQAGGAAEKSDPPLPTSPPSS